MARITKVSADRAQGEVQELYKQLTAKLGRLPNIFQSMGNSAAVLKAYMGLSGAAEETSFDAQTREKIALAIAELNGCDYCLAAHTAIGKMNKLSEPEILAARRGEAEDAKTKAILEFSRQVVANKAEVSTEDVAKLKSAGVNDRELTELILLISLNVFTNYFNHIVDTDIDFPKAPEL